MSFQSEIREKPWWEENESQCIKYLKENTEVTIPYKMVTIPYKMTALCSKFYDG